MSLAALSRIEAAEGLDVRLDRVGKHFGGPAVLRNLSLHVPAGQFLAIVGRSGSGKSTLLRLIGGLEQPSSGTLHFDGAAKPREGAVRIMFQEPRLLPWARVADNVTIGLPKGQGSAARAEAIAALQSVGLETRAGEWPAVLSGGQQQRVALARALVSRPRLLMLDEPLGALDALTRLEMQGLLETVWRDQGFTAILVTHDVAEAVRLADRIILLEDGAVTLDLPNPAPRPRGAASAEVAALERQILERLMDPRGATQPFAPRKAR